MTRLNFYLKYAWRSVLRGGQRSFFAVLCVAVGVAALVALQSLSASIRDTLIGDINTRAGGDVIATGVTLNNAPTSDTASQYLNQLKSSGQITDWAALYRTNIQIRGYFSFPPTLYSVDPAHFPLYGKVEMVEPSGGDFRQLLSQPGSIIVSKYLWDKNGYKLGQELEVAGQAGTTTSAKTARLKIVGMVKPDLPGVGFDAGLIFGFALTSQQTATTFINLNADNGPDPTYYIKTPPGTDNNRVVRLLQSAALSMGTSFEGYDSGLFYRVQTATELQEQIGKNLNLVDDLLSYVGLLAILIGGIGVVNTMLVVIGRRTTEIATVKALGLKTRQTLTIFTLEALILGTMGSIVGVVLGVALGFGIKGVAEGLFFRPLNWGFYPGPIIIGLIVGILTSGVFGFLPSYAAGRVRPGIVLRQQNTTLPRIGGFAAVIIVILMTLALGVIAGVLLRDLTIGVIVSFVTLLFLLFLTAVMYVIVLLTGKLPAPFGPSLKMALRSFSRHRGRTATTLLVMTVGLFFITFIVIIADSIKTSFRQTFDLNLGFNVVALNPLAQQTIQIQSSIQKDVPGVQQVFAGNSISAQITSINGQTPNPLGSSSTSGVSRPGSRPRGGSYVTLSGRSLANGVSVSPNGPQPLLAGRNFTPDDTGKNVLLVVKDEADRFGVKVGDTVTFETTPSSIGPSLTQPTPKTIPFTVIGIVGKGTSTAQFEQGWVAPFETVANAGSQFSIFYMLIDRNQMKQALTQVQGKLVGGFVFDLGDLIDTFSRILDQVLAFPLLLSLLSLFSGAILIANNVALAVLERRTEIGVLKAIGAKRRRVLNILLWESGFVGLLGGLIGVGTGVILALLVPFLISLTSRSGSSASDLPITWSPLTAGLLLLLGVGLAVFATVISAWGAVQEKPLVVLRYE
ncbi:MAG TPA: FtsX-like permease family protein [Chloroflexia bacterium]|nr:FtsX-like permease family protein [Chloroflexia bacterium]